jgi:hydroxyethylthiazole kinase-like uncharacterized protein yjeF
MSSLSSFPLLSLSALSLLSSHSSSSLDADLMDSEGFSIDSLMELAGLAVAQAIFCVYPPSSHPRPLVLCGPGNNGGDALVAARHLRHFGYFPVILLPRPPKSSLYQRLIIQCKSLQIPIFSDWSQCDQYDKTALYSLLIDGIFGFSFDSNVIRPPYDEIIQQLINQQNFIPVVSIDIPSSWHVDQGPLNSALSPTMLISLTLPKLCSQAFHGQYHAIGGRFVPPSLIKKYNLKMPEYTGSNQICFVKVERKEENKQAGNMETRPNEK